MKTFIVSLVVFCLLMTGIIIYSKYLVNAMEDIDECIKDITAHMHECDWIACRKKIYKLSEIWDKNESILAMFNDHEDVDKINLVIGELKDNAQQEGCERISELLVETKILLERIKKNQALTLENILKVSQLNEGCHNML